MRPGASLARREDRTTFAAFSKVTGLPVRLHDSESELRNQFETVGDGDGVGAPTAPDWVMRAIGTGQAAQEGRLLQHSCASACDDGVPALARLPAEKRTEAPEAIDQFLARRPSHRRPLDGRASVRAVPNAQFVDLPGAGHYVFMTKEADVLREIHAFITRLPRAPGK